MKDSVKPGTTSKIYTLFIQDSAQTDGRGKTGLLYNSSGIKAYYKRSSGTASVAITLATITTLGTFVSGGFKEIDATNMPGFYEFHPPDACFASGADNVAILLSGATGMAPCPIEVKLGGVYLGQTFDSEDVLEALTLMRSALVGLSTGGGSSNVKFRDKADGKDRITASVDSNGNRTSVTTAAT